MRLVNPFKPTAGAEPPVLIGREQVIRDFVDGLDEGVGSPGRLMRITGPRGSGKTVLLTELGEIARKRKWIVVDETAGGDLCERLVEGLGEPLRMAGLSGEISVFGVTARIGTSGDQREKSLRETLSASIDRLPGRRGVLLTIDEAQDSDLDDMREVATAVQHLTREGRDIALVFAGITTGVLDIINGPSLTFLRRAKAEELGSIPMGEVATALKETIKASGLAIDPDALVQMAQATSGYAYLIQLVGYYVWREGKYHAERSKVITVSDVEAGVKTALEIFETSVLDPALATLSPRAARYVVTMASFDGPVKTSELAVRMGVKPESTTSARRQLIQKQIIESAVRGVVDFSVPHMRDYLRERGADILARYGE